MAFLPQPGESFGRYTIAGRIGRGGMGSVFEARESGLDRPVALKVLSSELADEPSFRSRFLREARILASLDSPHVIQVYEQGEHEGRLYIATQLVKGSDLHQLLQANGPMSPAAALDLVAQVASGLADAHGAGLLHRDVKPSNVLVRTGREGEQFAYLCDFGIAVQPDSHHTRTSGVIGTVDYMAPERHEGHDASVASDVYSLGCVLWAALSGAPPYAGTSAVRVAMAHLTEPVPTYAGPSAAAGQINRILARSLAKDPAARYASVAELRRDLLAAAEVDRGRGTGVVGFDATLLRSDLGTTETQLRASAPAPTPVPATEPGRRRGALAVAGVVLAIVAVGGTGYVLAGGNDGNDGNDAAAAPATASAPPVTSEAPPSAEAEPSAPAPAATVTVTSEAEVVATEAAPPTAAAVAPAAPPTVAVNLETVFPSLATDPLCQEIDAKVDGKAEVWECDHGYVMLRYSRWDEGYDRYAYFDRANGVDGQEWYVDSEFAGRAWTSYDQSAGEELRWQWSATYRHAPYSVSVEGIGEHDRANGIGQVVATAPSVLGLP